MPTDLRCWTSWKFQRSLLCAVARHWQGKIDWTFVIWQVPSDQQCWTIQSGSNCHPYCSHQGKRLAYSSKNPDYRQTILLSCPHLRILLQHQ
ncbi:hypothetical protein AVEN_109936-1 [Araneus ventricosus]|uniref:Uncharacterized protein n=1 Tax=Araneus ventricosus TaxID=182803 RepID=A0A4Y2UE27_ARAVE|nr:hypothetical protein AVEN_109936-1 [Araneus ventricosus]